ncbi:MAG: DUF1934 domain-containing protein [Lachnospiraceae bacterium]|nr:DUF1934 domain-containing protein [Lachnospiraceae bacterium]MDD3795192.1 DUF1934 domain-containing protein [Lachnospiraceae bacterium]
MTDEILVSVKGFQNMGEEQENEVEVIIPGSYCKRGDMHYIKYDEVVEGMEGSIRNLIKVQKDSMEVTKKGLTNAHMVFEEQKKNITYYDTPFGNLLVGIAATDIDLRETEEQIDVTVKYALEVNYEHLADCTIDLKVRPKSSCRPSQWEHM